MCTEVVGSVMILFLLFEGSCRPDKLCQEIISSNSASLHTTDDQACITDIAELGVKLRCGLGHCSYAKISYDSRKISTRRCS